MMPRRLLALCTFLTTSGCASAPRADSTSGAITAHVRARGGAEAIRAVSSLELHLQLVEPTFAVRAVYLANRAGCMRIDIYDGARYVQSEGLDSAGGWDHREGRTDYAPQPAGGALTLRHGIENPQRLVGLDELTARGHAVEALATESIEGTPYDRVRVRFADGFVAELYLDSRTHLIARVRERKPMHLAVDSTVLPIETQLSDYRTVAGVRFPFFSREVNLSTGAELGHTTVERLLVNSPAALGACERPPLPRR